MKKSILLCLLLTSVIGIIGGCSKNVGLLEPQLKSYNQIAGAPFLTDKTSQGMERRFAIDLATRLSLAQKEKTWIYLKLASHFPIFIQFPMQKFIFSIS